MSYDLYATTKSDNVSYGSGAHHDFTDNCKPVNFGVNITPNPTSFGSLCQGFVYTMTVKIHNHTNNSIRLKATCISMKENEPNEVSCSYLPIQIAPGIAAPMTFTIKAVNSGTCKYKYILEYGLYEKSSVSTIITAYVLPLDLFKNLSKQLEVHNKNILNNNVKCLSRIFDPNNTNCGSTVYTAELLDPDDVENLDDIPFMDFTYWDANSNKLCFDKELSEVLVDETVDKSKVIEDVKRKRALRTNALEEEGHYSKRSIENLVEITKQLALPIASDTMLLDLMVEYANTTNNINGSSHHDSSYEGTVRSLELISPLASPFVQNTKLFDASQDINITHINEPASVGEYNNSLASNNTNQSQRYGQSRGRVTIADPPTSSTSDSFIPVLQPVPPAMHQRSSKSSSAKY